MRRDRAARRGQRWTFTASSRRAAPAPYRPRLEGLEGREAPAVFEVTTTADGGPGSLRQAVLDANATGEDDTILLQAATYRLTLAGAGEEQQDSRYQSRKSAEQDPSGDSLQRNRCRRDRRSAATRLSYPRHHRMYETGSRGDSSTVSRKTSGRE